MDAYHDGFIDFECAGGSSGTTETTTCPCADPACQDDEAPLVEKLQLVARDEHLTGNRR